MKKQLAEEFAVAIVSPDERIWEGGAVSLSSKNSTGPFDILPGHANFVTIIKNEPIIVRTLDEGRKEFTYKNAVIAINNNSVSIYSDI